MAKPKPKCDTCQGGERFFDGCSHPECPKRRHGTSCWGAAPGKAEAAPDPSPVEKLFDQHE